MPTSAVALEILLILLPGFAAAYIVQLLAVRAPQTDLQRVTEALLFSFAIYVAYTYWTGGLPFIYKTTTDGAIITLLPTKIGLLSGLALAFALAMVAYVNRDGARFFRWIKLTERTSRDSTWNDVFQDVGVVVQVELKDGRSVIGIVVYYSDTAAESSVFLKDASWVISDGEDIRTVKVRGPGILLTKEAGIVSVSFLDPETHTVTEKRPVH